VRAERDTAPSKRDTWLELRLGRATANCHIAIAMAGRFVYLVGQEGRFRDGNLEFSILDLGGVREAQGPDVRRRRKRS
jgi:hypothetical protein